MRRSIDWKRKENEWVKRIINIRIGSDRIREISHPRINYQHKHYRLRSVLRVCEKRCRPVNHPHHHHREAQHQHCSIYVRRVIIADRIRVDRERLTWIVWVYWTWITSIIAAVVWAGEIEVAAAREASDIWPSVSSHRRVISSCLRPISRTPRLLMISSIRRELSLFRPHFFRLRQPLSSTMTSVISSL